MVKKKRVDPHAKKPSAKKSSPKMKRYQRKSPLKCNEIKVSRPLNAPKSKFVALLICQNKIGRARAPFPKMNNT